MTHIDDERIERLRARIADPARRVDQLPSELWTSITGQGLGGMLEIGRSLGQDLARLLQQGPDADIVARADELQRSMETPADRPLPEPATVEQLATAERRLGLALPPLLRRFYLEVANGGFGPGPGILGVARGWTNDQGKTVEDLHAVMLEAVREDRRWVWPAALLPIVDYDGRYACLDAATAPYAMVGFDFEELDEGGWTKAFEQVAPSFDGWIDAWLAPRPSERRAAEEAATPPSMVSVPEVTRAYWAAMTPEQRAEHGLPEKGWGRALFGDAWGDDPRDGSGG
jgi:SMI1 / KNR4 family (SUKH-1)